MTATTLNADSALVFYRAAWESRLARPNQLPPDGDWNTWLVMAGRGFGKTRLGAEWLAWNAARLPDTRWAIVAPTSSDARDTCAEGVSGVLTVLDRFHRLRTWNRSLGEIRLTNGSRIKLFSADEPDRLRGPQFHGAWVDELAAFRYSDAWDQLMFGLRLGDHPRVVVTTTPRPNSLVRSVMEMPTTIITRGSTFDNAENLSSVALDRLRQQYEGTRLGRQELYGELLEDVEGALFSRSDLDKARVNTLPEGIVRRVVGVDPAATSGEDADSTGIVVASVTDDGHLYVEADLTCRERPEGWARKAVDAYHDYGAHTVVAESNQGGEMVAFTLKTVDKTVPIKMVHASKAKRTRAEPIASLAEQGKVHMVGMLSDLEDELCSWVPGDPSPDRLDAMVWACTELAFRYSPRPVVRFKT